MSRRLLGLALGALTVGVGAGLGGALWVGRELSTPHAGWAGEAVVVDVPSGLGAAAMLKLLRDHGVLRRPGVLRLWLAVSGGDDNLQAGEYRFERPITPLGVLARLRRGEVVLHAVTLPEGLTLEETAARFAQGGLAEEEALAMALRDPTPIADLDPEAPDLEGYLFPDTYWLPRGEPPQAIARAMVQRFRAEAGADFAGRARRVALSVRQAVTLASMIEKETSLGYERRRVSRVFHNRLARGMPMQCDPTVIYAWGRAGRPVQTLRQHHLELDSAWNTYRVKGLPPGPICNPGQASLEAAVAPGPGDELYFVATPGGGHRFSRDLASHERAVREWRSYMRSAR